VKPALHQLARQLKALMEKLLQQFQSLALSNAWAANQVVFMQPPLLQLPQDLQSI
jgi:hypothetical protein